MPPDSSTLTPLADERGGDLREQRARSSRGRTRRRGRRGGSTPRRRRASRAPRRAGRRSRSRSRPRPGRGGRPARRRRRRRAAARGGRSCGALREVGGRVRRGSSVDDPVGEQLRRRRRRTSRGGTAWRTSGPFSTAATNRSPCSAQVTQRRRRTGSAGQSSAAGTSGRRRSARSRTARPRCRRRARDPAGASTVAQPMCGTTGGLEPVDEPGPLAEARRSRTPCSSPASNITCMPTQMPEHRAAAGEPAVDDLVAAARRAGRP